MLALSQFLFPERRYGVGSSVQTVRNLCTNARFWKASARAAAWKENRQYLVIKGDRAAEAQKELESWLQKTHAAFARSAAPR